MQFHQNELFLYYDPETTRGKQTRAYACSVCGHLNDVNYQKTKLTTTLWKELVNMLGRKPKDLLDKSNPKYQQKVAGNTFTMTGWLEVLANNPDMLKAPIAIYNKKAVFCEKPSDILRLDVNSKTSSKVPPHLKSVH
ncbi:MAG: ArsC/Spx/MgsR family protein [Bacteroidota bacterium]